MANNLTLTSAAFDTANQKFGTGALSGGYGSTSAAPLIVNPGSYTLESWIKTSVTPSTTYVATGQVHWGWIGMDASGYAKASYGSGSNTVNLTTTTRINDGSWHHVALVVSGSGAVLYVDGVSVATSATTASGAGATYDSAFVVGAYSSVGGNPWSGELDETALFTGARYTANFTPATSAYTGSEANLVALYHLDSNGTDSTAAAGAATTYTVTGPSSGTTGTASTAFSVVPNGYLSASVTVTPSDSSGGGTFTPASLTFASGASADAAQSFTYTPASTGAKTLSFTNSGSLTNPSSLTYTSNAASASFAGDNANIAYSPGNWLVSGGQAKTINAGAYLRTIFTGTTCGLNFSMGADTSPYPEIYAYIDGTLVASGTISSSMTLTIPSAYSAWPHHVLEVVLKSTSAANDRWNSQTSALVFTGLTLAAGAALSLPAMPSTKALIFGDSITEGCWTISHPSTFPSTNDPDYYDATLAYSYLQRQLLGISVGVIGFSSQGLAQGGSGNVPVFSSSYNYLWSGQARSFAGISLIVINQGTNDAANNLSTTTVQANMTAALNGLLAVIPSTCKIVVMEPFNGYMSSYTPYVNALQAAIASVNSVQVSWMNTTGFFSQTDSGDSYATKLHPLGVASIGAIAPMVAAALAPLLAAGSGKSYTYS